MSSPSNPPAELRHRNLPLLLLQARERVIARFRPILNAHGVTEQQWRLIRTLLERGPMEPRELVEVCQISSPSLAGVLARMDEAGWVLRSRVDGDQRRVRVALTAQSVALAEAMAPQIEAAYAQIEARLGEVFTQQFYAVLDALVERLDEPGAADPGGTE
ncbi:homoprotocatechuate degradation operon regulator HpaR [Sphaerotilus sp.]|uniref:homoprotocatechuate degradation operon regulator HpaR n=1 Tax=Sphaerotilus sp. TaxID=2093942 RepID=UPI0034E2EC83